jgi:signal transduction histidine kinase
MPTPDASSPSQWPGAGLGASGRASVWVVDDSALEVEVIREALSADFEVAVFTHGAAVLERLRTGEPPNVVVLDWYMPEVSGLEVCRFIRAAFNSAQLPILILTGLGTHPDLMDALAIGANDFVKKPVSAVELNARVAGLARLTTLHARLSETERKLRLEALFREHFMATLAHDLRQPLNTVLMGYHVLSELQLSEGAVAVFERQHRAAERMQRMVTDLLDSTRQRPESGMPIEKRQTDSAAVARTVLDELRSAHPDRELLLNIDGPSSGHWDADRLAQILSNLVGNALTHGEPNCPVDVRLVGSDDAIELAVVNRGQPIPHEVLQILDQPFGSVRSARRSSDGLGLGLHIVHHIVHAHGGTLSAASHAGETRVVVRLPREDSKNAAP